MGKSKILLGLIFLLSIGHVFGQNSVASKRNSLVDQYKTQRITIHNKEKVTKSKFIKLNDLFVLSFDSADFIYYAKRIETSNSNKKLYFSWDDLYASIKTDTIQTDTSSNYFSRSTINAFVFQCLEGNIPAKLYNTGDGKIETKIIRKKYEGSTSKGVVYKTIKSDLIITKRIFVYLKPVSLH